MSVIKLSIQGVDIKALVSTGAPISLLKYDVFQKLCETNTGPVLSPSRQELTFAAGNPQQVLGETEITVSTVNRTIKVSVVKDLIVGMILGAPEIYRGKAVFDFGNKELLWHQKRLPLSMFDGLVVSAFSVGLRESQPSITQCDACNQGIQDNVDESNETDLPGAMKLNSTGPPLVELTDEAPLSMQKRKIVEDCIAKMLAADIIEPSTSLWSSPVNLRQIPDGSWRLWVDFGKLNSVTVEETLPLPSIDHIVAITAGSTMYSKMEFKSCYYQFVLEPESRPKTAFRCHKGLFQFKRCPSGLVNVQGFVQKCLNLVFKEYIGEACFVCIDDIIVWGKNFEEHQQSLELVLKTLSDANLKLKPSGCHFCKSEIKLLGYVIGKDGKRIDPAKTEAIKNAPAPTNVKSLHTFLGLVAYYKSCIQNYADIVKPLLQLAHHNVPFQWNIQCQNAFDKLKQVLI